jgi:zinc D-Ala-D-Ala carboxypeptidase
MRVRPLSLLNAGRLEAVPAWLARARASRDARRIAGSDWLIRRKSDGRFLALRRGDVLIELQRGALRPGYADDLAELAMNAAGDVRDRPLTTLVRQLHDDIGLQDDYAQRVGLALVAEPTVLAHAGFDRYRRPLWLTDAAARAWQRMRDSARREAIVLDAISGYRSHDYQLGIFRRKLARGQTLAQILAVNAAPGYSEHHSGEALDIGTPGEPPAEESFETTTAFAWLQQHATEFGFRLSYPRDNPHGIVYEPWHWRWAPASAGK